MCNVTHALCHLTSTHSRSPSLTCHIYTLSLTLAHIHTCHINTPSHDHTHVTSTHSRSPSLIYTHITSSHTCHINTHSLTLAHVHTYHVITHVSYHPPSLTLAHINHKRRIRPTYFFFMASASLTMLGGALCGATRQSSREAAILRERERERVCVWRHEAATGEAATGAQT